MTRHHRQKVRVFLVEDEATVRRGIELLLGREPLFELCGHASRQDDALRQILTLKPDLVIVDLVLEEGNGFDLMRDLRAFGATPKLLVFSMHSLLSDVRSALRAGADGYVIKEQGAEHLLEAIHEVMLGRRFLTGDIAVEFERNKKLLDLRAPRPR